MLVTVSNQSPLEIEADGLIVGIPEGQTTLSGAVAELNEASGGAISEALAEPGFKGAIGQTEAIYPLRGAKARRLVLVGLGKDAPTPESLRRFVACGLDVLRDKAAKVAAVMPEGLPVEQGTEAIAEGAQLSAYTFDACLSKPDEDARPYETFTILNGHEAAAKRADGLTSAVRWVRDLSNMPGNLLNVPEFTRQAEAFAQDGGLSVRVLTNEQLLAEGFGCLTAVGRGSVDKPTFVIAEYKGAGEAAPVVLVGKGITFDTGGVCIKPRAGMEEMKTDMHGAATVLAAVRVAAERKLPVNLVALLPIAENMPSGDAYIPGDVLKAYNGMTVEVSDTDAEGRLILADALAYGAKNFNPAIMIDVATLTGSIIMALGYEASGLFSNDDELCKQLLRAGTETGEKLWRMPTWDAYNENIRSSIADVRHIGLTRGADATNAAMFLKRFAGGCRWAHIDIAGPSYLADASHYSPKGSTGVGVRLLVDWLEKDVVGAK